MRRVVGWVIAGVSTNRSDQGKVESLDRKQSPTAHGSQLVFVFEVLVLKDVGCGAYEAETHLVLAGFAIGKVLAADHHDLMHLAMIAVMDDLIDSGLADTVSGTIFAIVGAATAVFWILEAGALKLELPSLNATAVRSRIKTRVSFALGQNHGNPRHHHLLAVC